MKYTKELILSELHRFKEKYNRVPKYSEFETDSDFPSAVTCAKYFGSWNDALIAAGFDISNKFDRDFLISEILRCFSDLGKVPTLKDFRQFSGSPSEKAFRNHFGGWNNALKEAGLDANDSYNSRYTREQLLEILNQRYLSSNEVPRKHDFCFSNGLPSAKTYRNVFGSWEQALREAAIHRSEEFIRKANKKHNYKYDYSLMTYIDTNHKVKIVCKKHGIFEQLVHAHLVGQGCPHCCHRVSKSETKWLDGLNIPTTFRQKRLRIGLKSVLVDAYDPTINTVYEFLGDYYHGNPRIFPSDKMNKTVKKTHGELYQKTVARLEAIEKSGYTLVYIWECDFISAQHTLKLSDNVSRARTNER